MIDPNDQQGLDDRLQFKRDDELVWVAADGRGQERGRERTCSMMEDKDGI